MASATHEAIWIFKRGFELPRQTAGRSALSGVFSAMQ